MKCSNLETGATSLPVAAGAFAQVVGSKPRPLIVANGILRVLPWPFAGEKAAANAMRSHGSEIMLSNIIFTFAVCMAVNKRGKERYPKLK